VARTPSIEKDDAIERAATDLLLEVGYERFRMDEVALRAGVSKRTLYKRHPSKDPLIDAVARALFESMESALPEAPEVDVEVERALADFGEKVVAFLLSAAVRGALRVVVAESDRNPALGETFVRHGKEPLERRLAGFLRRCAALDVEAPDRAARELLGAIKEVAVWPEILAPSRAPSARARADAIESAVSAFVRAHRAHRARRARGRR
jgi:TetR/AcrR family transcriptional regulator of autoinduction and epiphytic fitness